MDHPHSVRVRFRVRLKFRFRVRFRVRFGFRFRVRLGVRFRVSGKRFIFGVRWKWHSPIRVTVRVKVRVG